MTTAKQVSDYIKKHERWSEELTQLREIFQQTGLLEEVKWGSPTYTLNGKLIAGLGAFKNHFGIWFFQGVFLKDSHKKLVNAQEGKTKALRQWKFGEGDPIEPEIIAQYIQEAIENSLAGKEVKPERKKGVVIPDLLKQAMAGNTKLKAAFNTLTPGKQREYAEYIGSAKREATKESRLEKITPMILEGIGLYDKYKNC
ncbi:MAG: hypothetical protein DWP94_14015 [Flavobacterium sp.]|nr:MAG: hypothetical protein DWP94_14015 [Flavobacterium sp.]